MLSDIYFEAEAIDKLAICQIVIGGGVAEACDVSTGDMRLKKSNSWTKDKA
jgi:hypothetical protein